MDTKQEDISIPVMYTDNVMEKGFRLTQYIGELKDSGTPVGDIGFSSEGLEFMIDKDGKRFYLSIPFGPIVKAVNKIVNEQYGQ